MRTKATIAGKPPAFTEVWRRSSKHETGKSNQRAKTRVPRRIRRNKDIRRNEGAKRKAGSPTYQ